MSRTSKHRTCAAQVALETDLRFIVERVFYQDGQRHMKKERVTTVLEREVAEAVRALAIERGAALACLVEEALREYLAARPVGSGADLLAQMPRRTGRPSRLDRVREARRRAALRKRGGRPLAARLKSDDAQP
jgi:hypothetical protein